MTTYYGVSAPLGSGKTTAALDYAANTARAGAKIVIAQPSIKLIDQSVAQFQELLPNVPVKAIHGECESVSNVARAITEHTKASTGGEALFITHSALMQCPYWDRRSEWRLIIDEAPQIFFGSEITLPATHQVLFPALNIEPYNIRYSRLVPGNMALLEEIAANRSHDQVYDLFQAFAAKLVSGKWDMFVLNEQWERFQTGEMTDGKLLVFGLIDVALFDGFDSTTIMSANLEQTLVYRYLVNGGHQIKTHKRIENKLRYTKHENGDLLTIHYAVENGQWSKRKRNGMVQIGGKKFSVHDLIVCGALEIFSDNDFVWLTNKDIEAKDPFDGRGMKLPHSPHGLNIYQHIHNAAILPALNPSPALYAFLDEVAHIDADEVRQAVYHESVYQAAGRISLRNPEDLNPKHVVVADLAAAEFLKELFHGADLMRLPFADKITSNKKSGRARIHGSDAVRQAEHRNRHKADLLGQLDQVNQNRGVTKLPLDYKVNSLRPAGALGGSLFSDIYSKKALAHTDSISAKYFSEWLLDLHERAIAKDEALLWSSSEFDPRKSNQTSRGLANITAIWGLWLDNDGGDLTIDQFVAMFPHLEMVIYNSASSTPAAPRWRVVIPTTCAMTVDVHTEIMAQIGKSLNKRNYYDKRQIIKRTERGLSGKHHGFDTSKFTASSLFYLPAQALAGPEASFFLTFDGKKRLPINPYLWVDKTIINHRPEPEPEVPVPLIPASSPNLTGKDPRLIKFRLAVEAEKQAKYQQDYQERIDSAVSAWQQHSKGTGNDAFFLLGASLARAGMSSFEIEQTLRTQASYAHGTESQIDRQAAISSIVRTLKCAA